MENVAPSIFSFVQPDLASFFSIKLIVFSKKKKKRMPLPKRQNQHVCHLYLDQGSQYRTGGCTGLVRNTIYFGYRLIPMNRFGFTTINKYIFINLSFID